jgi:hypothetical protein
MRQGPIMNLQNLFTYIFFFAVFALIAGSFIFKIFKYGGLKGAMFGAPIAHTVGQVEGGGVKFMSIALKVHTLGGNLPENAIGLELVAKSIGSYQTMGITLSVSEAKKLVLLLQSATSGNHVA